MAGRSYDRRNQGGAPFWYSTYGTPGKASAVEANSSWTCLIVRYCRCFISLFGEFMKTIPISAEHGDENSLVQQLMMRRSTAALNN